VARGALSASTIAVRTSSGIGGRSAPDWFLRGPLGPLPKRGPPRLVLGRVTDHPLAETRKTPNIRRFLQNQTTFS
jgi:hypothetical protein